MLFLKELKKVMVSVSFVVLVVALIVTLGFQDVLAFTPDDVLQKPQPGGSHYGTYAPDVEDPEQVMPAAFDSLYWEYSFNSYVAYPIGFVKTVKLNDTKRQKMADILAELSGSDASVFVPEDAEQSQTLTFDDLTLDENGGYSITLPDSADTAPQADSPEAIRLRSDITYEQFKACMQQADKLIGGGSKYSEIHRMINFGMKTMGYEQAQEQYRLTQEVDKFSGAYARLFCDYTLVCGFSLLPALLAVVLCLKDKQAHMAHLVFVRRTPSHKLILARFAAIVAAVILPVLALAYLSNASSWRLYPGVALDYLAPLKYTMGWILPTVLVTAALGMFFTELTGTPIAIAIGALWWFADVNLGVTEIWGDYSLFRLSPRHNSLQNTAVFVNNFGGLVANRLLMTGIALLLLAATLVVYQLKRRGKLIEIGTFKAFAGRLAANKGKSKA